MQSGRPVVVLMFRRCHRHHPPPSIKHTLFGAKSQITACCIASSGRVVNRRRRHRRANNSAFLNLPTRTRAPIPEDRILLVHHGTARPTRRGLLEYLRMLLHLRLRLFRSLKRDADDWPWPTALSVPFSRAHRPSSYCCTDFAFWHRMCTLCNTATWTAHHAAGC